MEDLNLDIFNLLDSQPEPSRGSMLVAKPTVEDLCFKRSVSILIDHDAEGSMGVIVNKPTRFTLNELMPEIECNEPMPLYLGGPVGTNMLFFLHTLGADVIPESVQLAPGVFFGGSFDVLKMFLESGQKLDGKVKFLVGYSGWTVGQLDNEVKRHDWAVLKDNAAELVFNTPDDLVWCQAVKNFGDQYRLWTTWPDDVSLN
ncbi:MAG: YqgE/AlgH family protein [Muribaculaceae bacterium]|nr:YqgE/AlgH family protein [Muribaculaceae bacterium]